MPSIENRGVHLDLKGLPPTPARLLKLLELIAAAGFTFVLVEWEDTFPWQVDPRFRNETAYTLQQIKKFHDLAAKLGLNIIPLIQSLGHMEMPLRLPEYAPLREVADRCDVVNPLAPGARHLVERMIDDVLQLSGPIDYFHLGGDEAWTFGTHPDTRKFIEHHGKPALYLHHVEPLLDKLLSRGIRPILWHDMMHDWDAASLARLGQKADVMFWSYRGHPDNAPSAFNSGMIRRFIEAGVTVWGACAFKGADSRGDGDLPDAPARISNATAWAEVAARFKLRGVVATGWSRYSTHRVQCEPIDGALDALIKVGAVLRDGHAASDDAVFELLAAHNESATFAIRHTALTRLAEARRQAWQAVLLYRMQIHSENDPRRRGSGVLAQFRQNAHEAFESLNRAADEMRQSWSNAVPSCSIEEYLAVRLAPIETALAEMSVCGD
jgi:hexosaminidase